MKNEWIVEVIKELEKSGKYATLILRIESGIIVNARQEESLDIKALSQLNVK